MYRWKAKIDIEIRKTQHVRPTEIDLAQKSYYERKRVAEISFIGQAPKVKQTKNKKHKRTQDQTTTPDKSQVV